MTDTSDERALATWLTGLEPLDLARLLLRRGVSANAPFRDGFDVAEGLLDAASVDRALTALPRSELIALGDAVRQSAAVDPAARPALRDLALLRADGRPFAAVASAVARAATARPSAFAPVESTGPAPAAADAAESAAAAERAAASVGALADLVSMSLDQPLTVTAAGAVTATDRRRLVETHVVADGDELDDLLALGAATRLLVRAGREWRVTEAGEAWLLGSAAARWTAVATSWRDALPAPVRASDGSFLPPDAWAVERPLDPDWPATVTTLRRRAVRWGLLTPTGAVPAWTTSLLRGGDPDTSALAALLPDEIDAIYLQADLTAIAPGPLTSALDLRLRTMATRESRAQASTYRFSAESLAAAVAAGETAASLRTFLETLSLTGIPQPLAYLIDQVAARHGLVRVGTDAATGRTRVDSDDPQLLDTIAVDQSLRAMGFVSAEGRLTSRIPRDAVYWGLADTRYPVVAVDADGAVEPLHRRRSVVQAALPSDPATALLPLAEALRASGDGDADAAWLERELEQAVRARATVVVAVRLPDGSAREFTLEAAGLGGGRLRGRDRAADIERTLPVSSIVGVRPLP
ncbi:MAG: helicase-associated domain-containing protein [Microbacterium sp.]|uniref:helicase-associated domain-containing protein n=1 Tax=Microbacterium sp. TaxID=51671 RepID=UPI001AC4CBC7|nr:helicase-associated domain-containing protein [Microbacterium sp.]MBN9155199.1 helicase-associated domain-containing protein [Microbacterium sp.]